MGTLKLNNNSGFTMTEVLVAIAIISVVAYSSASVSLQIHTQLKSVTLKDNFTQIRENIISQIQNPTAWRNTVSESTNTSLDCLRQHTSCTGISGPFLLKDITDASVYDSRSSNSGFNSLGEKCDGFDEINGNVDCPYRLNMNWEAICVAPCIDQVQAKVTGHWEVKVPSDQVAKTLYLKKYDFELFVAPPTLTCVPGLQWAWVAGANTVSPAVYGTLGIEAPGNMPEGGGTTLSNWKDVDGNLWIFGPGQTSNIWKYNPLTNRWSWIHGPGPGTWRVGVWGIKGIASPNNYPSGRIASKVAVDNFGNPWIYGGWGADVNGDAGNLSDLWKYDVPTNQWIWMSGSNLRNIAPDFAAKAIPSTSAYMGNRRMHHMWVDKNNILWFFGGATNTGNINWQWFTWENDLWSYNPATREWTYFGGSINDPMMTKAGIATPIGMSGGWPSARLDGAFWSDNSREKLYVFGGEGDSYHLNDLWSFDISTKRWTWVSGSNTGDTYAVYGTKGVEDISNTPGAASVPLFATDKNGYFWLYGGAGNTDSLHDVGLSDLWRFNPTTKMWKFVDGDKSGSKVPVFGSKLSFGPSFHPGKRDNSMMWTTNDSDGVWIFGGYGTSGDFGDLWKFGDKCKSIYSP